MPRRTSQESRRPPDPTAPSPSRPASPIVVVELVNRQEVTCMRCGGRIKRGEPVRVTITPGGGPNQVEHPEPCPRRRSKEPSGQ